VSSSTHRLDARYKGARPKGLLVGSTARSSGEDAPLKLFPLHRNL
jgi:hypothetical protein